MDLSVITVTWNSEKHIAEQINSVVGACTGLSFEQIVVDNHSTDCTVEIVRQGFSRVKLVQKNYNTGFAAACNEAARIASGDFFLFLNPDMRAEPGSFKKLVDLMRARPEVGVLSCKLTGQNGQPDIGATPRRFPSFWSQLAIFFKLPHLWPGLLNRYLYRDLDFNAEQEVDSVRGSFLLLRRKIYEKLGFAFDPRYFIWFEDVDLCREAKRLDYKVLYTPLVSCMDYVGQSFSRRKFFWKQKNFFRSAWRYFRKWGL